MENKNKNKKILRGGRFGRRAAHRGGVGGTGRPRLYLAASPGQRGRRRALQNALRRPFARFGAMVGAAKR